MDELPRAQQLPPDVDAAMHPTYDKLADSLYERVRELPAGRQFWVACAGAPGCGKTALTLQVARRLQQKGVSTAVVPMDGYHYYRCELDAMEMAEEMHRKRGAIFTFNAERFVKDLKAARECGEGVFPSFNHKEKDPREGQIKVHKSDRMVLVEGNYIMVCSIPPWGELQGIFDEKWFISCQPEVARARVIARHMGTGLTQVEATYRVDDNDMPNGALIDKESRPYATRIITSL